MKSKLSVLLMLLFMLGIAGHAFAAATVTSLPGQVPKGAYVNGPGGATDDNYYWQTIHIAVGGAHAIAAPAITITLPAGMTVADTDGDVGYADEVSIAYNTAGVGTFAVGAVTASTIQINVAGLAVAAPDDIYIMFPVETESNPADDGYAIDFADNGVDADITAATGPQVTFRDAGALGVVTYTALLAADDDTTSTSGEMYPATVAALFSALPDLVEDAEETMAFGNEVTATDGNDTNDITYTLWVATDSTLSHIDELTSGVLHAIDYDNIQNYTQNEDQTGGASRIATSGLPEGNYYFYITSSLTGDFPLGRSGQLNVLHYPIVKIMGWDYTNDTFDNSGAHTDNFSLTVDSGAYFRFDGTFAGADTRTDVDLYVSVDDFDDDAGITLFYSTNSALTESNLVLSGAAPNVVVDSLSGATAMVDTLNENQQDVDGFIMWNWDLDPVTGTYIPAADYYVYAVANDGKHQSVLVSKGTNSADTEVISLKHSPDLIIDVLTEYDTVVGGAVNIDPAVDDVIMLSWGKANGIAGDSDLDDSCIISFYIDYEDAVQTGTADYHNADAGTIVGDVDDLTTGTHLICSGLLEDLEAKDQSYYAWNLKQDFIDTGWMPTDGDNYHLYAVIDENKTGGTQRVVALGDDGLLGPAAGEDITEIVFTNNPFGKLHDPPAKGVVVNGDETYRMRFDAFDFDANAEVGVFVVKTSATPGPATMTQAVITGFAAGDAYALTSTTGALAAGVWLNEDTDTFYDLTIRTPADGGLIYTTSLGGAGAMTDGEYWVYIGVDDNNNDFGDAGDMFYRAPGTITLQNIAIAAPQRNVIMAPTVLTISQGDTINFQIKGVDEGFDVDIMDFYVAVEKQYYDIVNSSSPFTDSVPNGSLLANEAIDDSTNGRWILHATAYNDGNAINPVDAGLGDVIASIQLVSKGTLNAVEASSAVYFVNEPSNGWVTQWSNDGNPLNIDILNTKANIQPRGIVEGIVEFEGRDTSDYTVTFELRERGSYVADADTAFYNRNDTDSNLAGVQYMLDTDGKFSLFQIPSGEWDLVVKYDRYLAKLQELSIYPGLDTLFVNFGTLFGGDCFGYTDSLGANSPDNQIDATDLGRIKDAYLDTPDSSLWDNGVEDYKWADIDESGKVYIEDLTMATRNVALGVTGAQPVYKPAVGDNLNALVEFDNVPVNLTSGQKYTIQVNLRNAGDVYGYFVDMKYDSSALQFAGIAEGTFIEANSYSFPVVRNELVGLASSSYGRTASAGDGTLAEISFIALNNGVFTPDMLSFNDAVLVNGSMMNDYLVVDQNTGIGGKDIQVVFDLNQNFPNPFNPTTSISFSLPEAGEMTLKVYDVLGRHVKTLAAGTYEAGNYSVVWDATDMNGMKVSAGIYFYRIDAGRYQSTKRMMFLK